MNLTPSWLTRSLPFAVYMIFVLIQELIPITNLGVTAVIFYILKTSAALATLIFFWRTYNELTPPSMSISAATLSLITGAIVFTIWIHMDWSFATLSGKETFNPYTLSGMWFYVFVSVRLFGSSLVVPVMEEIFWRSFILRYIINPDFTSVKLGTFSWPSFVLSSVLFGLEHHLWLAGIMAGAIYNLLLYRTKNLYCCILAHGVTNLMLGIYVITERQWHFW